MQLNLSGKTAIVTGGSAGIGLACAQALYAEGVSVLIAARDEERLAQALGAIADHAPESTAMAVSVSADVSTAEGVEGAVSHALSTWGHVDILINNAGSAPSGDFYSLGDDAYHGAWDLKLLGYMRMVRALAPQMKARGGTDRNIVGARRQPDADIPGRRYGQCRDNQLYEGDFAGSRSLWCAHQRDFAGPGEYGTGAPTRPSGGCCAGDFGGGGERPPYCFGAAEPDGGSGRDCGHGAVPGVGPGGEHHRRRDPH